MERGGDEQSKCGRHPRCEAQWAIATAEPGQDDGDVQDDYAGLTYQQSNCGRQLPAEAQHRVATAEPGHFTTDAHASSAGLTYHECGRQPWCETQNRVATAEPGQQSLDAHYHHAGLTYQQSECGRQYQSEAHDAPATVEPGHEAFDAHEKYAGLTFLEIVGMKAILIDPFKQEVREIEINATNDRALSIEMHRLIGADTLDHQRISDDHDSVWLDDAGLKRGEPVYAFKLPIQRDPYAGTAVIIGADHIGRTRAPLIPIEVLRNGIEWLGRIVPEVVWEETERGSRAIVTYARAK
jgi:hypothetical protein